METMILRNHHVFVTHSEHSDRGGAAFEKELVPCTSPAAAACPRATSRALGLLRPSLPPKPLLRSNPSVNRTPGKLRLQVPSALRAPAAGYLERWASPSRRV
jgi:hypothetical protein